MDRAYFINERRVKHWFKPDEVFYIISDGINKIEIPSYHYFTIDTDESLGKPLLRVGNISQLVTNNLLNNALSYSPKAQSKSNKESKR